MHTLNLYAFKRTKFEAQALYALNAGLCVLYQTRGLVCFINREAGSALVVLGGAGACAGLAVVVCVLLDGAVLLLPLRCVVYPRTKPGLVELYTFGIAQVLGQKDPQPPSAAPKPPYIGLRQLCCRWCEISGRISIPKNQTHHPARVSSGRIVVGASPPRHLLPTVCSDGARHVLERVGVRTALVRSATHRHQLFLLAFEGTVASKARAKARARRDIELRAAGQAVKACRACSFAGLSRRIARRRWPRTRAAAPLAGTRPQSYATSSGSRASVLVCGACISIRDRTAPRSLARVLIMTPVRRSPSGGSVPFHTRDGARG